MGEGREFDSGFAPTKAKQDDGITKRRVVRACFFSVFILKEAATACPLLRVWSQPKMQAAKTK